MSSSNGDHSRMSSIPTNKDRDVGGRGSNLPDDIAAHVFSFQQRNSPHKENYSGMEVLQRYGAIEEEDEDIKSSKEEMKKISNCNDQSIASYEENLDDVIEKISLSKRGQYNRNVIDVRMGENQSHRISTHSMASSGIDSKEQSMRNANISMIPHYHQLIQKGLPVDLKKSGGSSKTEARAMGLSHEYLVKNSKEAKVDHKVSSFKTEDLSKKGSTKDGSIGTTFESARRNLINNIGESYQSKESMNSLGQSFKGKQTLSQLDSEQIQSHKEVPSSRFDKINGKAMSIKPNTNYMSEGGAENSLKDYDKKVQSTNLPYADKYAYHASGVIGNELNCVRVPINEYEVVDNLDNRRVVRNSKPPIDEYNCCTDHQPLSKKVSSKTLSSIASHELMNKGYVEIDDSEPPISPKLSSRAGYLDRFQRKKTPIEERGLVEVIQPANNEHNDHNIDKLSRKDKILDRFIPSTHRNDSNSSKPSSNSHSNQYVTRSIKNEPLSQRPQILKNENLRTLDNRINSAITGLKSQEKLEKKPPLMDNIMNRTSVIRRDDILLSSRNRPNAEDIENSFKPREKKLPLDNLVHPHPSQAGYHTRGPVKSHMQGPIQSAFGKRYTHEVEGKKPPLTSSHRAEDQSIYRSNNGHTSQPRTKNEDNSRNKTRAEGGFNIKIDISHLSNKMMASMRNDNLHSHH